MKKLFSLIFTLSASCAAMSQRAVELKSLGDSVAKYDDCGVFSCDRMRVVKGDKAGFVDKSGRLVVDTKYYDYYGFVFQNGFCKGYIDRKPCLIDTSGRDVTPPKIKNIYNPHCEYANAVMEDGKSAFVKMPELRVIPMNEYDDLFYFSDGRGGVKRDGKCGFVDKNLKEVIEPKYEYIGRFSDGYAVVKGEEECEYYIDTLGFRHDIDAVYDKLYAFRNGLALFELGWKIGAINTDFEVVIPPDKYIIRGLEGEIKFDYSADNLHLNDNEFDYYFNWNGEEIYRFKRSDGLYTEVCNDFAVVNRADSAAYVLDRSGNKYLYNEDYEGISCFDWNLFVAEKNYNSGLVNLKGEEVLPFEFDWILVADKESRMVKAKKNGKWHFFMIEEK